MAKLNFGHKKLYAFKKIDFRGVESYKPLDVEKHCFFSDYMILDHYDVFRRWNLGEKFVIYIR